MNFPPWVISIASLLLLLLIGIGFALPGRWEVSRSVLTEAAPEVVWSRVSDLRAWDGWAPLGGVESEFSDPSYGFGATRSWDSEDWGAGTVRITTFEAPSSLRYEVEVQDGSIRTEGHLEIEPAASGTTIRWTEVGDFGWNPFLAFIALGMERTQGAVLEEGLRSLKELAEGAEAAPAIRGEGAASDSTSSAEGTESDSTDPAVGAGADR